MYFFSIGLRGFEISCLFCLLIRYVAGTTFKNPLKNPNGSDPFMVYTAGHYHLLTTTWSDIEITRATTLEGLKTATPTVVWTDTTASRAGNFWAPGQ